MSAGRDETVAENPCAEQVELSKYWNIVKLLGVKKYLEKEYRCHVFIETEERLPE